MGRDVQSVSLLIVFVSTKLPTMYSISMSDIPRPIQRYTSPQDAGLRGSPAVCRLLQRCVFLEMAENPVRIESVTRYYHLLFQVRYPPHMYTLSLIRR